MATIQKSNILMQQIFKILLLFIIFTIIGCGESKNKPNTENNNQLRPNGGILKPETYNLMVNSEIIDSDYIFSHEKSNYGYGVNIHEGKPFKYIGHAGRGIGFVNLKIYVPEKKLDIIIMENVYNRDIDIVYHFEKTIREIVMNSNLVKQ